MPAKDLRIDVFQFAPELRATVGNMQKIAAVVSPDSDLVITPELSLTGYDLRDDVHTIARPCDFSPLSEHRALVGFVDRDEASVPYNVAAFIDRGVESYLQRKVYLPTYGMFDEGRYFGRGRRIEPFNVGGWNIGLLICEDYWHPMLAYLQAMQGADALVVMAAAPGRGVWQGGDEGAFFSSSESWLRIARAYAQLYGTYVIVCNRTGVEGGVTFAGESFVVAPSAELLVRAGIDEEVLTVTLDHHALRSARMPYAHARDENLAFAISELQRIGGR